MTWTSPRYNVDELAWVIKLIKKIIVLNFFKKTKINLLYFNRFDQIINRSIK